MANNKVVFGNQTIIDMTDATATADDLDMGATAYDRNGNLITGTAKNVSLIDATAIPSNADLNDYTTVGNYYTDTFAIAQTVANVPSYLGGAFTLKVYHRGSLNSAADTIYQVIQAVNDGYALANCWIRRRMNTSAWSKWTKLSDAGAVESAITNGVKNVFGGTFSKTTTADVVFEPTGDQGAVRATWSNGVAATRFAYSSEFTLKRGRYYVSSGADAFAVADYSAAGAFIIRVSDNTTIAIARDRQSSCFDILEDTIVKGALFITQKTGEGSLDFYPMITAFEYDVIEYAPPAMTNLQLTEKVNDTTSRALCDAKNMVNDMSDEAIESLIQLLFKANTMVTVPYKTATTHQPLVVVESGNPFNTATYGTIDFYFGGDIYTCIMRVRRAADSQVYERTSIMENNARKWSLWRPVNGARIIYFYPNIINGSYGIICPFGDKMQNGAALTVAVYGNICSVKMQFRLSEGITPQDGLLLRGLPMREDALWKTAIPMFLDGLSFCDLQVQRENQVASISDPSSNRCALILRKTQQLQSGVSIETDFEYHISNSWYNEFM